MKYVKVKPRIYILYFDLDGVLSDFKYQAKKLLKDEYDSLKNKKNLCSILTNKFKDKFWKNMPFKKDSKDLWNKVKNYKYLYILSAYPISSKVDKAYIINWKYEWVLENLGKKFEKRCRFCKSSDKKKYSKFNSILVDDNEKIIEDWNKQGGIGILHKNPENTIKEINKYINLDEKDNLKWIKDDN